MSETCCGEYIAGSRCPACPDRATFDQAVPSGVDGLVEPKQVGKFLDDCAEGGVDYGLYHNPEVAALSPVPAYQVMRDALERHCLGTVRQLTVSGSGERTSGAVCACGAAFNELSNAGPVRLQWAAHIAEALTKSPPQETVEAIIERCAEVADSLPGWKQPRDVAAAIRALKPEQP